MDKKTEKKTEKKRKKRKRFYKVKKNRPVVSLILFLILSVITAAMAYAFVGIYMTTLIENKLSSDIRQMKKMIDAYEKTNSSEEDFYGQLDNYMENYAIFDKDGKLILENGLKTYDNDEFIEVWTISNTKGESRICLDTKNDLMSFEQDTFALEEGRIIKKALKALFESEDLDADSKSDKLLIELPFWCEYTINSGTDRILCRLEAPIYTSDVILSIGVIAVFGVVLVLTFIILLVGAIKSVVNTRRLTKLCFTDLITKGYNKIYFLTTSEKIFDKHSSRSKNFAIVSLFISNFRRYCVCHSVVEGDDLLYKIGSIIKKNINKKEISAHSTDEEFVLLLNFTNKEELRDRVSNLLEKLSEETGSHGVSFHAGINLLQKEPHKAYANLDIDKEYNNACTARSRIEDADNNGIMFFDEAIIEEQRWIDAVTELQQKALDNEEFKVYYQPKYDPRNDELRGAEALIRWDSPELGFVTPYRFIPIFEKNGFIKEIDHYMISHVARDQKRWLSMGYECVPVSVNVSRAHFIEEDLAEQIRDMVDREGTDHRYIEIELTESAFFDDKKAIIDIINKLKSYNFMVSMDDFGSGYSSLNSLKDMPLDVLKLDAEFFRGENADSGRAAIVVSEAIRLAKNLNMRTVAEGIEQQEQVKFLAEQDCDMIQGYYYSKPVPMMEYEHKMKKKQVALSGTEAGAEPGTVNTGSTLESDEVSEHEAEVGSQLETQTDSVNEAETGISLETRTASVPESEAGLSLESQAESESAANHSP